MTSGDFAEICTALIGEMEARHERFCSDIKTSWNNLEKLLQKQVQKITIDEWQSIPNVSLASIRDLAAKRGSLLLHEPLFSLKKAGLLEKTLSAIEQYQLDIENILRPLPQAITVSRDNLTNQSVVGIKGLQRFFQGWGSKSRSFRIRAVLRQVLLEQSAKRAKLDGQFLLIQIRATLTMLVPWQLLRYETLRTLEDNQRNPADLSPDREVWIRSVSDLQKAATRTIAAYDIWKRNTAGRVSSVLAAGKKRSSKRKIDRARNRWQNRFRFWARLQGATVAHLALELSACRLLEISAKISEDSLVFLDDEHSQLLSELEKVRIWLECWKAEESGSPFPLPEARLMSSEDRVAEWSRKIRAAVRSTLPVNIEMTKPSRLFAGLRTQSRILEAEASFAKSLEGIGRIVALSGFREAEEGHRTIIREIERAREVAAYSIETSGNDTEEDRQVARDGIANALSLINYQNRSAIDHHPAVERSLTEALASTFLQFYLNLEEARFGRFRHLARKKASRVFRTEMASVLGTIKSATDLTRDRILSFNKYILIRLGWSPPSTQAIEAVIRREYLNELMNIRGRPSELPAIYKRLFRLDPLEDQRFLVGRDAEMNAIGEARQLWQDGRAVAILVAGARGSGKTSLLNCAQAAIFRDLPVIRGQFGKRITSAQGLRLFLSSFLQADVKDLDSFLNSDKRLVILEEVERTFMRRIGGFEGLRSLLDLIATTSRNTLWILSINETALRYLTNTVGMEEFFSHKINAAAVAPAHLRNAILLRHNLSGLRLQFAAPKSTKSRIDRLWRLSGLDKSPEQLYFELFYQQSEGIFRAAFELWQQSVDRVEGGVLYMLTPSEPDYDGIISRLTLEDSFILQSILQHGSLTPKEVSLIFDCEMAKSNSRLEKLVAWEVLEVDPISPGFRVRPEAGRMVREALYRQNLL
jgi:hypothetical protein